MLKVLGVVGQWCNCLTLQPEQSGGVDSRRSRAPPLEFHDKGSQTRLALSSSMIPVLGAKNPQLHLAMLDIFGMEQHQGHGLAWLNPQV